MFLLLQKTMYVKVNCRMQKKIMEEEEKNSRSKVGIIVAMVKWEQLVVDVCVTTQGQRASMLIEEPPKKEISPTRG